MEVARLARWRTKKKRRVAAGNSTLPEDVVLEVLVRVADVAALFRCTVACKRWRDLVSEAAFLRRRWPDPPSLIGFFARQRRYRARARGAASVAYPAAGARRAPALVPAPGCPLGPVRRSLGSFVPCAAGLLDDAVPLVSRDGVLLVRLVDAPADVDAAGQAVVRLAVCNLIDGTCDLLPPLKFGFSFAINSCAVLTFADGCCSGSAFFRVLVLILDRDTSSYTLCAFSSTEPSWSAPIECFSSTELGVVDGGAVVHRGTAHWLVTDTLNNLYTLEVSDDIFLVGTHIPPSDHDYILHHTPCLSVATDGTLSVLRLCKDCLWLEVWTRQDEKRSVAAEWMLSKAMELKRPKNNKVAKVQSLCLDERSGTLFVEDDLERMYVVDLDSGAMDEVTDQFWRLKSQTAVPFEMDWPAFFESRLAKRRETKP